MIKRKYWYKYYIDECPPCGKSKITKERQYIEKPADPRARYEYHQYMCYNCAMGG